MHTTIIVPGDAAGSFFDLARELLRGSTDKGQVCLAPNVSAAHDSDGLAIKFSSRVLRPPVLFQQSQILGVVIDHTTHDGTRMKAVDKKVVRRRAWATVSSGGGNSTHLVVRGETLQAANRLYQDILDGTVLWR